MRSKVAVLALVCALAVSCSGGADESSGQALEEAVYTGCHPTAWMAQTIAGGKVPVECLLPKGADAIFWNPDREALARYQRARLVVQNGAEFEKWMETASLARSRVCNSSSSFKDRFITFETLTHSHGGGAGEHTHEGVDGHTWLDPDLAVEQARAIALAMKSAWPEHAAAFDQGLRTVETKLSQLKTALSGLTPKLKEYTILASHPAYNYLRRAMGWAIANLDIDPASPLQGKDHVALTVKLEGKGPKRLLLWESTPLPETVRRLEEKYGVVSVVFSPGENLEGGFGSYWAEMEANVERLRAALK